MTVIYDLYSKIGFLNNKTIVIRVYIEYRIDKIINIWYYIVEKIYNIYKYLVLIKNMSYHYSLFLLCLHFPPIIKIFTSCLYQILIVIYKK